MSAQVEGVRVNPEGSPPGDTRGFTAKNLRDGGSTAAETLPDAARSGDRLAALRCLRDRLAAEIEQCASSRDVAALSRQFRDTLAEIDVLGTGVARTKEDEIADELARRRSARSADSADRVDATGSESH